MNLPIVLIAIGCLIWFFVSAALGAALVLIGCVLLLVSAVR